MALLSQGQPDRVGHLAVDNLKRRGCGLLGIESEWRADPRQRCFGRNKIERDLAAEEIVRIEKAEHHRCIGHRGFLASTPEASRARTRPCAVGSNLERGTLGPDDAAAASPHRSDIERRDEIFVLAIARGRSPDRCTVENSADVERRAANVGGDDVAAPANFGGGGEAGSANQACDRTRPDR